MYLEKSIAVTGHQPFLLGGYGDEAALKLRNFARSWLRENKPKEVISGLAAGWDTAVAEAAIIEDIPLVSALAYRGQADEWPEKAKQKHGQLIEKSIYVYVYSDKKEHGCYTRRDRWVLDRGDIVLALWSGVDGGTARAISHANKLNRPIVNLWSSWEDMSLGA